MTTAFSSLCSLSSTMQKPRVYARNNVTAITPVNDLCPEHPWRRRGAGDGAHFYVPQAHASLAARRIFGKQ